MKLQEIPAFPTKLRKTKIPQKNPDISIASEVFFLYLRSNQSIIFRKEKLLCTICVSTYILLSYWRILYVLTHGLRANCIVVPKKRNPIRIGKGKITTLYSLLLNSFSETKSINVQKGSIKKSCCVQYASEHTWLRIDAYCV